MNEHRCFSEPCLYCVVTALFDKIDVINEDKIQLATENIILKRKLQDMDKLINKVSKDVSKKDMPKAKKDIKVLKKADKIQDKKVMKCDMKMKKKK
jgi:hypothetical protein